MRIRRHSWLTCKSRVLKYSTRHNGPVTFQTCYKSTRQLYRIKIGNDLVILTFCYVTTNIAMHSNSRLTILSWKSLLKSTLNVGRILVENFCKQIIFHVSMKEYGVTWAWKKILMQIKLRRKWASIILAAHYNNFFLRQRTLRLITCIILMHLLCYWWSVDRNLLENQY